MKYLIVYKEDNTFEGYLDNLNDFDKWLKAHNKSRKEEGSIIEGKNEFEIYPICNLLEELEAKVFGRWKG